MGLARTKTPAVIESCKPGAMFVIPPLDMIDDELRLARLEQYLEAEFPHLAFNVTSDTHLAGRQSAVGVTPLADGSLPYTADEAEAVISEVLDAVILFVDYGHRRH